MKTVPIGKNLDSIIFTSKLDKKYFFPQNFMKVPSADAFFAINHVYVLCTGTE